jgi:hypothetical protein
MPHKRCAKTPLVAGVYQTTLTPSPPKPVSPTASGCRRTPTPALAVSAKSIPDSRSPRERQLSRAMTPRCGVPREPRQRRNHRCGGGSVWWVHTDLNRGPVRRCPSLDSFHVPTHSTREREFGEITGYPRGATSSIGKRWRPSTCCEVGELPAGHQRVEMECLLDWVSPGQPRRRHVSGPSGSIPIAKLITPIRIARPGCRRTLHRGARSRDLRVHHRSDVI